MVDDMGIVIVLKNFSICMQRPLKVLVVCGKESESCEKRCSKARGDN